MKALWFVLVVPMLFVSCASPQAVSAPPVPTALPCTAQEYLASVQPITSSWTDASLLAGNTQRINLPTQIEKLQALRRDFQAVSVPSCAADAHAVMTQSMDDTVQAYLDFLAQKDEGKVSSRLQLAKQYETAYQSEQERLQKVAAGQDVPPVTLPQIAKPVPVDQVRTAFDNAGFKTTERSLADGRTTYNGTKGDVSLELVADKGSLVQIFLMTDKGTMADLIEAGKVAFPDGKTDEWKVSGATGKFFDRTKVTTNSFGGTTTLAFDLF